MSARTRHRAQAMLPGRMGVQRCAGLSLVELMVAIAVGLIVLLGLADILANTRATYTREEAFARLQENGRIASLIAAKHMRPSRSTDCKSIALHQEQGSLIVKACDLLEAGCTGDSFLDIDRPLGFDGGDKDLDSAAGYQDDTGNFQLPKVVRDNIADHWVLGDVLVTWGVEPNGTALSGTLSNDDGTGDIPLENDPNLDAGDIALVSNCQYAHVFKATSVSDKKVGHAKGANATDHLRVSDIYQGSSPYMRDDGDPRAQLYPLVYRVFYICCVRGDDGTAEAGRLQDGGDVKGCRPYDNAYDPAAYHPSLCVFDLQGDSGGESNPLVPNVADMRVTYSGDSDGDGNLDFRAEDTTTIHNAEWVTDNGAWAGVRSATVELLLTTELENSALQATRPASIDWPPNDGTATDPDDDTLGAAYEDEDRRFYQRFRFEVALRPSTLWMAKY